MQTEQLGFLYKNQLMKQEDALKIIKSLIDVTISKGIFQNLESVININNAFVIISEGLKSKEDVKGD